MKTAIAAFCALATGCASTVSPTSNFDALMATNPRATSDDKHRVVNADYTAAITACETEMKGLRDSVTGASKTQISLATVGVLAGSIVVPALAAKAVVAKSTVAAWGGVSGAANAGQYILQENGTSGSARATVYETLRQDIKAASAAYTAASSAEGKAKAVSDLAMSCKFPPLPTVAPPAKPAPA